MDSSDESSDDDYKPQSEDSDILSEAETDYDSDGNKIDKANIAKSKKRRKQQQNRGKKRQIDNGNCEKNAEVSDLETSKVNEEEEKRRSEALWADFLNDTSSTSSFQKAEKENSSKPVSENSDSQSRGAEQKDKVTNSEQKINNDEKPKLKEKEVTKIFDFAGEKVVVTEKVKANEELANKPTSSISASNSLRKLPVGSSRSGLGSVLSQLGKKNKLSTLEKTKHDWNSYKKQEGIEEELQTFNKGKDGFLQRQDFLERTDLRQFEIEKNLRQTTRKNL